MTGSASQSDTPVTNHSASLSPKSGHFWLKKTKWRWPKYQTQGFKARVHKPVDDEMVATSIIFTVYGKILIVGLHTVY